MPRSVAFVTVSKGRLHHLRHTLPLLAAQAPDELVVVDYGCPDRTADWVLAHVPSARALCVEDDPGFCLPRARNLGAAATQAEWLCFIDADVGVQPGFVDWLRAAAHPACFFRAARVNGERDLETWGTFACSRRDFERLGGYDETFRGWGGEDADLYRRLAFSGRSEASYPAHFVAPIRHADDERTRFHAVKSRELQALINETYSAMKYQLMTAQKMLHQPTPEVRQAIMRHVTAELTEWDRKGRRDAPRFRLKGAAGSWMPPPYRLEVEIEVRCSVVRDDATG